MEAAAPPREQLASKTGAAGQTKSGEYMHVSGLFHPQGVAMVTLPWDELAPVLLLTFWPALKEPPPPQPGPPPLSWPAPPPE